MHEFPVVKIVGRGLVGKEIICSFDLNLEGPQNRSSIRIRDKKSVTIENPHH